ncbi:hypothetical protein TIFTF001_007881 [Ficus carica]|uniref:Uncharacterized protein n=1 Tax=Ficus carica TaxID=3494 RepID=A0AA88DGP7_FICCA|nr:hypothetical protein TIFTF001_007881 [Ficus carica]
MEHFVAPGRGKVAVAHGHDLYWWIELRRSASRSTMVVTVSTVATWRWSRSTTVQAKRDHDFNVILAVAPGSETRFPRHESLSGGGALRFRLTELMSPETVQECTVTTTTSKIWKRE